jgi:hypothetical protein
MTRGYMKRVPPLFHTEVKFVFIMYQAPVNIGFN